MVRLENDAFLNELTKLFESTRLEGGKTGPGSVFVTFKKLSTRPKADPSSKGKSKKVETSDRMLVRATNGRKVKISTEISQKSLVRFQMSLTTILKAHMDGLHRRARKGAQTTKTTKKVTKTRLSSHQQHA